MKVSKLPKDPGPCAWNAILAPAAEADALVGEQTADWLIVGAGFAGLSAARQLSLLHPHGRIVVLEAGRVAEGPAGRNSGFMIDLPHDLASEDYAGQLQSDIAQTQANREAIRFAAEMAEAFELTTEAFSQSGKINAAATQKGDRHNQEFANHLAEMGESYEMLDASQMRDLTGTDYYHSGLSTPGTAMLQPALYVRGIAKGLRSNRLSIYENSAVLTLSKSNCDWVAKTRSGQITAPKVILAVNGHINSFGYFHQKLMHVFTYASMTSSMRDEEVSALGGAPVWGVTPADPLGTTVRKITGSGGTRIVVRNRFTYEPTMEVSGAKLAEVAKTHDASFRARFPMLANLEIEYRWGGRLCLSRNNVPAFGEVEHGVFSACCQNGLGTTKGTLGGMAAAQLASGQKTNLVGLLQSLEAPSHLPPEPLMSIGATARLRYGEWKAGREL